MTGDLEALVGSLDPKRTKRNEPLAPHTTLKIGGSADVFFEADSISALLGAVAAARTHGVPFTLLWGGSNVLISDEGIRGLVIRNRAKGVRISREDVQAPISEPVAKIEARWQSDSGKGTFKYDFADLDYDESDRPRVLVTIESGADLLFVANRLMNEGITGFQWYAGIPGSVGGAVYNNIHGGSHFINETLVSIRVLGSDGIEREIFPQEGAFDYDKSRFHGTDEVILDATFRLFLGDVGRARSVFSEWAKRKALQPRNSPGCAFANISRETMERHAYPTTSVGYLVEHVLKMGDFRVGNAAISSAHRNFVVNLGGATAKDYLAVLEEIVKRARSELGIRLIPEIFFLGFPRAELERAGLAGDA